MSEEPEAQPGMTPRRDIGEEIVGRLRKFEADLKSGKLVLPHRIPRQGWRYFYCENIDDELNRLCAHRWREPCRDASTPSGVDCPSCHGWVVPCEYELDENVKVDNMGNLISWYQASWPSPLNNSDVSIDAD